MTTPNEEFRKRYKKLKEDLGKPANNKRSTRRGNKPSIKAPKNNIKPTGGTVDTKKLKSKVKRMANKAKAGNRRDYIAKTTKAGVDEFNNTKIRPSKGGKSATTGQVAKFNKSRLIKSSAKPTLRGGLIGLGMSGVEALGRAGKLGKKIKQSFDEQDRRVDEALNIAKQKLRKLRKRSQGK